MKKVSKGGAFSKQTAVINMCKDQSKPGVLFAYGGGCRYSRLGVNDVFTMHQGEMKEGWEDLQKDVVKQGLNLGYLQGTLAPSDDQCLGTTALLGSLFIGPRTLFPAPFPRQKRHLLQDQHFSTQNCQDFIKTHPVWKKWERRRCFLSPG